MTTNKQITTIAGLTYIIIILLGTFSVNFAETNFVIQGNLETTFNNFVAHELLFRAEIVGSCIMYALVIFLSWALYEILKPVNRKIALLALLWRFAEAIIGSAVAITSGLIPLLLINNKTNFDANQLYKLFDLFLKVRVVGLDFVLVFVGAGGTLFFYLFFKSRYIPKFLAGWGILTYISMFVLGLASLLVPNIQESTKMIFFVPGGLFEFTVGFWLLIKGVKLESQYR